MSTQKWIDAAAAKAPWAAAGLTLRAAGSSAGRCSRVLVALALATSALLGACSSESGGGSEAADEGAENTGESGSDSAVDGGDSSGEAATDTSGGEAGADEGNDDVGAEGDTEGPAADATEGGVGEDTTDGGDAIADGGGDNDITEPDVGGEEGDLPDTDGADEGPDTGDEGEEDGGDADGGEEGPATGYPSSELAIRIAGPQPTDVGQVLGTKALVNGVLFGHADTITYTNAATGETGDIAVDAFWQAAAGVKLVPGDNPITVVATNNTTLDVATDTITVTHNPGFIWDGLPWAEPNVVFVNQNTQVVVRARMGALPNFNKNTVELWTAKDDGTPVAKVGDLKDNGATASSCDEIQGDDIFSDCLDLNVPDPGVLRYRVRADVTSPLGNYEAWSPPMYIEAFLPVTQAECTSNQATLQAAKAAYMAALESATPEEAQAQIIETLLADETVAEAGPATDGFGVWVAFENGILGALNLSAPGMRGTGGANGLETGTYASDAPPLDIGSKRASVLAPFLAEFAELDEAATITENLEDIGCPAFDVSYRTDAQADLFSFRRLNRSGVIAVTSHGDAMFKSMSAERRDDFDWESSPSMEIIWTGEQVNCSNFLQNMPTCSGGGTVCGSGAGECVLGNNPKCVDYKHADLRRGRLVMGDSTYGILPSFVDFHARQRSLPRSVVYLGACRTLFNGGFAAAFFANGAKAVAGYSGYVSSQFASDTGTAFFDGLVTGKLMAGGAMEAVGSLQDPEHDGSEFRLFGAKNLSVSNSAEANASFETGDLTAWEAAGDGRVVSALGATQAVDGKFMGLISTGLGFTQTTGELKQSFCIDPSKTKVSFYWKYYSEEFLEWCGSQYQDAFRATIKNNTGQLNVVDVTVDSLCPAQECGGCGGQYVGLVPSDVVFDQGGVYNTSWQKYEGSVVLLAGTGPVTLAFFTTDAGDSVYDTVILVDKLEFK
jgi:hypothetical protein